MPEQCDVSGYAVNMQREIDRTKSEVFMRTNGAFYASLLCSSEFVWSKDTQTACTDGVTIFWNPDWFLTLSSASRHAVLIHELNHTARLHFLRGTGKNGTLWNIACDHCINLAMIKDGYDFSGLPDALKDISFSGMAEEQIYEILIKNAPEIPSQEVDPNGFANGGDMAPSIEDLNQKIIRNVIQATQAAETANQASNVPSDLKKHLDKFLKPVIPWQTSLMRYFTDMQNEDYTWQRPNRRHSDIYLPHRFKDDGKLAHLVYFIDSSGSISSKDSRRFNSEMKYIQEEICPERLTIVQFSEHITDIQEFVEGDQFNSVTIVGGGGTVWEPVSDYIDQHNPTAAIIFTDMGFWDKITPPKSGTPVLWCIQNNPDHIPSFGDYIHIKE